MTKIYLSSWPTHSQKNLGALPNVDLFQTQYTLQPVHSFIQRLHMFSPSRMSQSMLLQWLNNKSFFILFYLFLNLTFLL